MSHKPLHLDHKPVLIGLAGYAGAGKDTAARVLSKFHGFQRFAFADSLKAMVRNHHPEIDGLVQTVGWERAKREYPHVREQLVKSGIGMREEFGPYFWVNLLAGAMNASKFEFVCITDVRFVNEAAWVRENGGIVVRVERPGVGPANEHEEPLLSERPVVNFEVPESEDGVRVEKMTELGAQLADAVRMAKRARDLLPIFDAGPLASWETY